MAGFWDNTVGPPGLQGGIQAGRSWGIYFHSLSDLQVVGLSYYHPAADSGGVTLRLWDRTGPTVMQTVTSANPGHAGWVQTNFGSPAACLADHGYCVEVSTGAWQPLGYFGMAPVNPPSPLVLDTPDSRTSTGWDPGYPTDTAWGAGGNHAAVDIVASGLPGSGGTSNALTSAQMDAKLVSWFSDGSDNLHHTDLPYETKQAATSAATSGTAIQAVTDRLGALSNGAIAWLNNRSAQLTDLLNTVSADAVTALNNLSTRITGNDGTGGSAFKGPSGRPMATTIEDVNAKLDTLAAAVAACCDWLDGRVLNELKLSAPVTYTVNGYGYLETLRNVHRISVGTVPAEVSSLSIDGHLWLPRFGWWAPVTAQGAVLERHYIDWHDQWLWPAPAGTVGIAFHLPLGVDATVYAYTPLAEP